MKIEKNRAEIIIVCVLSVMAWGLVGVLPGVQAADPPAPSPTVEEQKGPPSDQGTVEERGIQRAPMPILPLYLPGLPNPVLAFTGADNNVEGAGHRRYYLAVTNHAAYPNAMFAPAPNLPACGKYTNSSRTWVDIFDLAGKRLSGFCTLGSSDELAKLWFLVPAGSTPQLQVYAVLNDRQANKQYISNPVTIP